MSLLRFKALTFEVVGTLVDFERGMLDYLHIAAPAAGVEDSEFLAACREMRASPLALFFPEDLERVWHELARRFGLPAQAAEGFRTSVMQWPAFADSVAALKRLKKHYRLVAATNAQRWALGHFEYALERPFDWTLSCDDTKREKPDPRYFVSLQQMLARHGIRPCETLHVGQSQFHDIRIAQALGWRTCWIERRGGASARGAIPAGCRPAKPDWHFDTLRQLADAVEAEVAQERQAVDSRLFAGSFEMSAV